AYDAFVTEEGLFDLAGRVDGVSVGKARLVDAARSAVSGDAAGGGVAGAGATAGAPLTGADLVDAAHSAGLEIYTWTLRPENRFLTPSFRRGRARAAFGDWFGEFAYVIGTGVDGIFVDHPDLGVEARAAFAET
ncbi:MAG TPA: glycerophosphodiester phosphodiesterase family protein, partial [Agromyces sp.]